MPSLGHEIIELELVSMILSGDKDKLTSLTRVLAQIMDLSGGFSYR